MQGLLGMAPFSALHSELMTMFSKFPISSWQVSLNECFQAIQFAALLFAQKIKDLGEGCTHLLEMQLLRWFL